jgi:ribonuclease HI/exonuclease III
MATNIQNPIISPLDPLPVHEEGNPVQAELSTRCLQARSCDLDENNSAEVGELMGNPATTQSHSHKQDDEDEHFMTQENGSGYIEARNKNWDTLETIGRQLNPESIQMRNENWDALEKIGRNQGIRIGTFNMRGRADERKRSKYKDLTTLIRKNGIAILAVQETRLNDIEKEKIENANPKILIESNSDSTAKEGVGFILNKDILQNKTWKHTTIIKGRASRLQINWNEEDGLDIINIYAPNETQKKIEFLEQLQEKLEKMKDLESPMLVGDFNFVEEDIDRFPVRKDDNKILVEMNKLIKKYQWIDGWRITHPNETDYTFCQKATGSKSRIDRIYTTREQFIYTYDWGIVKNIGMSDHEIAYVDILKSGLPFIGPGLWRLSNEMLEYQPFIECAQMALKSAGIKIMRYRDKVRNKTPEEIEEIRTGEGEYMFWPNPQQIWLETKTRIKVMARERAKEKRAAKEKEAKQFKDKIKKKLVEMNEAVLEKDKKRISQEHTKLVDDLKQKEKDQVHKLQEKAKARYALLGETCSKYWFNLNKPKLPSSIIFSMQNDSGKTTTKTRQMVDIASNYHRNLQKKPVWTKERGEATNALLSGMDKKITKEQSEVFEKGITRGQLSDALRQSNNGKSPGADGIPYELYKKLRGEKEGDVDVEAILFEVFKDQEQYGITEPGFLDGIMSLLYKKKDKRKIENYRPLTLLNTDYKLYTKTIATKLGQVAKDLIDEDQGGFIPGRGLYDHTRTSHEVIEYCELIDFEGCVLSLDQEKAYDKIDHRYLWIVLEKYGFPEKFINHVRQLYLSAKTTVMVNGVLPKPIRIDRGVRQGDPMSCILYNLAIEPLAENLRRSELKGLQIPGIQKKVLTSLFADDTLVYLGKDDDMKVLKQVIDRFCLASTAKFNIEKTECLPLGNKQQREKIINTRKMGVNVIEGDIKIIKDGECMRTLGAWVGNGDGRVDKWNKIIQDQQQIMELWQRMHLSFKGKELVLKALIQSKAVFLATVNGMPKDIEETMQKNMKDFLWEGKERGLVRWEIAITDKKKGGLGMPDLKSRLEAIEVMHLKKYLAPKELRPKWAWIVDEILFQNTTPKPIIDNESKKSWILQTWHESMSKESRISHRNREMLRIGRKYNIGFDTPKISKDTKSEMPMWHHIAATNNYLWNKKGARQLRQTHKVETVGDLIIVINSLEAYNECENHQSCMNVGNSMLDILPKKYNPTMETPHKDRLDHTPTRKRKYETMTAKDSPVCFNPDITERRDPEYAVRIFRKDEGYKKRRIGIKAEEQSMPAYRKINLGNKRQRILYTDGSATLNGYLNGTSGAAVYEKEGSKMNKTVRLPEGPQTNQKAELVAIILALQKNISTPILVKSDSLTTIEGITKRLTSWEDKNWLDVTYKKEWKRLAYLLRRRTATTEFQWVKAHDGEEGNEAVDKEAKRGAELTARYKLRLKIPEMFQVKGARLQTLTQAQAYRLVLKTRTRKTDKISGSIRNNLENAQDEIERITGLRPTSEHIWLGLRKVDNNKIADFIWKLINNLLKCGEAFKYMEGWEDKQFCNCGELETPYHLLLDCEKSQVKELWQHIGNIWNEMTEDPWIPPSMGLIQGIGAFRMLNEKGKDKPDLTKRYIIFISETIWVIWKARNRRVFEEKETDSSFLINRWNEVIKSRIKTEHGQVALKEFKKRNLAWQHFETLWCTKGILATLGKEEKNGSRALKINSERLTIQENEEED